MKSEIKLPTPEEEKSIMDYRKNNFLLWDEAVKERAMRKSEKQEAKKKKK